jgi:oxygen-independent coproporphyrinogen-3 oxidase
MQEASQEFSKKQVMTVFLGGGTPSILSVKQTEQIMDTLYRYYDVAEAAEITTEANPGTLDAEKLRAYHAMGMNRLSMGLQSALDQELQALGRIHTYADFCREYEEAQKAGFTNINVDLMSGVIDQTPSSWYQTLERVAKLSPAHISAYSLIIEEKTPLHELYRQGKLEGRLVDEDTDRKMYHETEKLLSQYGYHRYEISNYAKQGYECRHNLTYWERGNYAGFGIGAASLIDNVRYKNTDDLKKYIKFCTKPEEIREDRQALSTKECMEEFMFLGLRKTAGVSRNDFFEVFHRDMKDIYGTVIDRLKEQNLLMERQDRICLTQLGLDVCNVAMAEFLLDEE